MSNYTFEYQESNRLVPEGAYETVLTLERKITDNGKLYLSLKFTLRDDIEEQTTRGKVTEIIWEDRDNPGRFPTKKLSKILSIQGKDGRYNFSEIDEVLQHINGWDVKIGVRIGKPDEYHQEEYNYITYYAPTKYPKQSLNKTEKINVEVSDEELPF